MTASDIPPAEMERRQTQSVRVETAQKIAAHEDKIRGIRTGINVLIGAEKFHLAAIEKLKHDGQNAQGAS